MQVATGRPGFRDYARFGTLENGSSLDINLAATESIFGTNETPELLDIEGGFKQSLLKSKGVQIIKVTMMTFKSG